MTFLPGGPGPSLVLREWPRRQSTGLTGAGLLADASPETPPGPHGAQGAPVCSHCCAMPSAGQPVSGAPPHRADGETEARKLGNLPGAPSRGAAEPRTSGAWLPVSLGNRDVPRTEGLPPRPSAPPLCAEPWGGHSSPASHADPAPRQSVDGGCPDWHQEGKPAGAWLWFLDPSSSRVSPPTWGWLAALGLAHSVLAPSGPGHWVSLRPTGLSGRVWAVPGQLAPGRAGAESRFQRDPGKSPVTSADCTQGTLTFTLAAWWLLASFLVGTWLPGGHPHRLIHGEEGGTSQGAGGGAERVRELTRSAAPQDPALGRLPGHVAPSSRLAGVAEVAAVAAEGGDPGPPRASLLLPSVVVSAVAAGLALGSWACLPRDLEAWV